MAKLSYAKLTHSVPKHSLKGSLVSCISWPPNVWLPMGEDLPALLQNRDLHIWSSFGETFKENSFSSPSL